MKRSKILIVTGILAVTAIASSAFKNLRKTNSNKGFAVIELFTSEGCSSCPPADELIAKIQKENSDKPVYILAFHVDYWNRLGWKDIFSSADYSRRQRDYAQYLNISSVYTPQIVVNGKKEFVGSEEGTLRNAIKAALQKEAPIQLTLSDVKINPNQLQLHYQAADNGNHSVLLLAVVQKSAQSHVKAGENGGRILSHVQIVQKLQSIALSNNKIGVESITLPNGLNPQNLEIIGLIQNTSNGEITGAAKVAFPAAANSGAKNAW
jgi:hypothetical protein